MIGSICKSPVSGAVHTIVTAHHRADGAIADLFHHLLKLCEVFHAAARRRIATVEEGMDDYGTLVVFLPRPAHDLKKVLLMGMHPLILQQSKEVKTAVMILPVGHKILPMFNLKEFSGAQSVVDALELLSDNPSCPNVEVAYFGRTLIAVRKTDRFTSTIQKCPRVVVLVKVDIRGLGCENGVAFYYFTIPPSVANYQAYRSH
jgi:hypothetical protein